MFVSSDNATCCTAGYAPFHDYIMVTTNDTDSLVFLQTLHQKYGTGIQAGLKTSYTKLIEQGWDPKDAQAIKAWIFILRHEAGHRNHSQKKIQPLSEMSKELYADFFACKQTKNPEVLEFGAHYFKELAKEHPAPDSFFSNSYPHPTIRSNLILHRYYKRKKQLDNYQAPIFNTRLPF